VALDTDSAADDADQAGRPAETTFRKDLVADVERLDQELTEITMLVGQASAESERHESRRQRGEERVRALESDPRADAEELREAHQQLLSLTRRQMLFETQKEVLQGKQKTLQRFRDRLARLADEVQGSRPGVLAVPDLPEQPHAESAAVLRAQEGLRRDIARQMHDGPAQSLANIALQAEIVERLVERGDKDASAELGSLRQMVQSTLAATKDFIFDVRPMVLDDLGLVPTLRRAALDRGHRSGLEVDFDSSGADRRLSADLESGVFRLIDDLLAGYVALRPQRVMVRLDWAARELSATVRGHWGVDEEQVLAQPAKDVPPALAAMIEQHDSDERQARTAARSLPDVKARELLDRATMLGVTLTTLEDGRATEIGIPLS
jgi:two-component system, NarL family, sensor histidine kinase DegS